MQKLILTRYSLNENDERIYSQMFYAREEDLLNQPEYTITTSNMSDEEIINLFMKQPIELQRFPSIKQAVDKLCEELEQDEDYYNSWKANIAMAFKDEFHRKIKSFSSLDSIIHEISNTAADTFLKQLIR